MIFVIKLLEKVIMPEFIAVCLEWIVQFFAWNGWVQIFNSVSGLVIFAQQFGPVFRVVFSR